MAIPKLPKINKNPKRCRRLLKRQRRSNKIFGHDASIDFLLTEYEYSCLDAQHHNNLQVSVLKFAFSFYVAFLAVVATLYEHFMDAITLHLAILLAAGFWIGITLLLFMIRNRSAFVRALRQSACLRKFFLDNMEIDFKSRNCLYVKPEKIRYFKKISLYTFSMLSLVTFNTIFAIISLLMFCKHIYRYRIGEINLWLIFLFAAFIFFIQIYIALAYLQHKEKQDL